jgi:dTDP-4-dehydrorhamnose reductase
MMALSGEGRAELKVVSDQRGNPTSAAAAARALGAILRRRELRGVFHLTCEGDATWAEFAEEIFRLAGVVQKVRPCSSGEFPRPAPRPGNSRLEKTALRLAGLPPMPDWKSALAEFMAEEFPERGKRSLKT